MAESAMPREPDHLLVELSRPTGLRERPGLERMRRLVAAIGDPQRGLPVIHVGGTSGKGSTSTLIAAILQESNVRVGLHAKPHLSNVTERFVLDGQPVEPGALAALIESVAGAARHVQPTWHELTVAVALRYFAQAGVTAVIEVGLGGEFDSTNVVEPLLAVITNIGLDHTEVLGDTIAAIAQTKAGIIKPGCAVVTAARQPEALGIIEQRCASVGAHLWRLGREIKVNVHEVSIAGSTFDLRLPDHAFVGLRLALLGEHQIANAALAIAAVEKLRGSGYDIPDDAVRRALASARVPGRLEVAAGTPDLVLDGAHSPPKMAALVVATRTLFMNRKIVGLVAFKKGHDLAATLSHLAPLLDAAVVTRFDMSADFGTGTAHDPEAIAGMLRTLGGPDHIMVEEDATQALQRARGLAVDPLDGRGLVLVTGSLYLVGQVRTLLAAS